MNLKKYAYDMWVLSQEDQRRGNPSGVEMGFDLFRTGCLTGTEPLEGFDSGVDWAQAQAEWVETMATQTQREEAIPIGFLRTNRQHTITSRISAYEEELREAFQAGDRAQFDAIMAWPRHSEEDEEE